MGCYDEEDKMTVSIRYEFYTGETGLVPDILRGPVGPRVLISKEGSAWTQRLVRLWGKMTGAAGVLDDASVAAPVYVENRD
jgi:hypothetical protein